MKVIIPVAGFGTRLRPHTLTKAKVLINVAGKPMISHIAEQIIKDKLASEIILITEMQHLIFSQTYDDKIKVEKIFTFNAEIILSYRHREYTYADI